MVDANRCTPKGQWLHRSRVSGAGRQRGLSGEGLPRSWRRVWGSEGGALCSARGNAALGVRFVLSRATRPERSEMGLSCQA